MDRSQSDNGLTLVEAVLVVVIIAAFMVVLVPLLRDRDEQGNDRDCGG